MTQPNRIMTEEEYTDLRIKGLHLVCKDYRDEPGCIAVWYLNEPEYFADALHRYGLVPAITGRDGTNGPS